MTASCVVAKGLTRGVYSRSKQEHISAGACTKTRTYYTQSNTYQELFVSRSLLESGHDLKILQPISQYLPNLIQTHFTNFINFQFFPNHSSRFLNLRSHSSVVLWCLSRLQMENWDERCWNSKLFHSLRYVLAQVFSNCNCDNCSETWIADNSVTHRRQSMSKV